MTKTCPACGRTFKCKGTTQRCCSRSCGARWRDRHVRESITPPNSSGLCMCGCGQPTPLAPATRSWLGHVKGEPMRYINGHNGTHGNILAGDDLPYEVRDCGYETPCWYWLRHTTTGGYARVTVDGVRLAGHVVYYERTKGPVPEGRELDHLCRVRRCVNPDHLEAVTHAENVRRGSRGKVSTATLIEIRNAPGKDAEIAARYGLSQAYVNRIRRGLIAGAP